jgi:CO dehydrogenase maturation factor
MCEECRMHEHEHEKPVIAVCGKGGVGKTVFSALLARVLLEEGLKPLLLVDADPVGGLTSAIGEKPENTLAGVRDGFIGEVRKSGKAGAEQAAGQLDFFVFNALAERDGFALLAMGRNREKGCFCPANKLLRNAIEKLIPGFACVLIDAEAGIEQINRDVTERVTEIIVVVDGSARSMDTLKMITAMVDKDHVAAVVNRATEGKKPDMPGGVEILGCIPEDEELKNYDRQGKPLWLLPDDNEALKAVRQIGKRILKNDSKII